MKDALGWLVALWLFGLALKVLLAKYAPEQYEKIREAERRKKERNHKLLGLGIDVASKFIKK